MSDKDEQVIIYSDEEDNVEEKQDFTLEGLSEDEVELAKETGLYKEEEDGEHKEQTEPKTEEDGEEGEDTKEEDVLEDKKPDFEDVEGNEDLLEKYSKPEQALYWKWKTDKQKRQDAQEKAKTLEEKLKEAQEGGASKGKIDKIKALLANPDSLTIEALESVLGEQIDIEEKTDEPDPQAVQRKIAMKAQFAEKIGSAKYENFNAISELAKEVIAEDKSGVYQKSIDEAFLNDDIDEAMLVERVMSIARLSPKFGDAKNQVNPEDKEKVDRVLNNSKKKVSSASVSGASGRKIVSQNDLTYDEFKRMNEFDRHKLWDKLKPETQERLLRGK